MDERFIIEEILAQKDEEIAALKRTSANTGFMFTEYQSPYDQTKSNIKKLISAEEYDILAQTTYHSSPADIKRFVGLLNKLIDAGVFDRNAVQPIGSNPYYCGYNYTPYPIPPYNENQMGTTPMEVTSDSSNWVNDKPENIATADDDGRVHSLNEMLTSTPTTNKRKRTK